MTTALVTGALLLAATACASSSTVASVSPSAPASHAASPTPVVLLCRLPIDRGSTGSFLDIPAVPVGGVLNNTDDPTSAVSLPDGELRSGLSYDWAFHRWLPVPFELVAPDGAQYVYTDSQSRIHLVKLVDGSDSVVASGARWGVYALKGDGIYAGQRDPSKQPSLLGLWRIPTAGGVAQQIATGGSWTVIGTDAAWSVWDNGGPAIDGTVLTRFDLQTGQSETWYTSQSPFRIVTLDASQRPVLTDTGSGRIMIVTSAGAAQTIFTTSTTLFSAMADTHGVWVTEAMTIGVYLSQGGTAQRLGQYGYGGTVQLAGPCG